jgi:pimeloyl-ACP methyl ester carboxylesterase
MVERLVLVGPTMDPAARTTLGQALRYARNIRHEKLPVILRCVFDYLRAGLLQCFRAFKLALHDRIEEKLPRVRAPTLVLRGERDPIAPERWVRQMVALLPFGRAGALPGGHAAHHSSAGLLARKVMAFLREPPPA